MQGDADVRALVAQMAQLATVTSTEDLVVRWGSCPYPALACIRALIACRKLGIVQRAAHLPCQNSQDMTPGGLTCLCSRTQRIAALSDEGDSDASGSTTGELRGWDEDAHGASAAAHHTEHHRGAAYCPHLIWRRRYTIGSFPTGPSVQYTAMPR